MALSLQNLSRLFSKIPFQTCSHASKTPGNSIFRLNFRHISNSSRNNSGWFGKERILGGLCVACCVTSSAWLLSQTQCFKHKQNTLRVFAAEPWVDKSNAESPRNRFNFVAGVVKNVAPAVVYIEIQGRHPFTGQSTAVSNGSGFLVREDGLILTNAHVVANQKSVKIRLHDNTEHTGVVQAVDPVSDLATVKINGTGFPILKLGKSSELQPGEWVVALGSPFQLSNTVTAGIVSTPCRGSAELGLHSKDMEYIQTDATINFGNSGGPLVNLDGEAIGINTMKVTTGISFAIPSDYTKEFLEKAKNIENRSQSYSLFGSKSGAPKKRYLGITMLTLTPSLIVELKSRQDFPDVQHGVLIHRVVVGSPAYSGGLRPGDIILKINNKDTKSASDVYLSVEKSSELKMTIQRGANVQTFSVPMEDLS